MSGAGFRPAGEHLAIDLPGATALFTTRGGGDLHRWTGRPEVEENMAALAAQIGIPVARWAQGHQVHEQRVRRVATEAQLAAPAGDWDGQATTLRDAAVVVVVADCLPVALAAPEAVAMLHAGWRGLAGGVIEEGVAALRELGATAIAAAIGPGIGPCCYAVGDEVRAAFGTSGATVDLKAIARERLRAAGVEEVHDAGICTFCDPAGRFFSHRRDHGVTGRQAGIAWRT